jgi:hypothetical protein
MRSRASNPPGRSAAASSPSAAAIASGPSEVVQDVSGGQHAGDVEAGVDEAPGQQPAPAADVEDPRTGPEPRAVHQRQQAGGRVLGGLSVADVVDPGEVRTVRNVAHRKQAGRRLKPVAESAVDA